MRILSFSLFLIGVLFFSTAVFSQEKDSLDFSRIQENATTKGSLTLKGSKIQYRTTIGVLPILDKSEQDTLAQISFTAYVKEQMGEISKRPITFIFNGGPGSSTLWLHMGSFGPKRVHIEGTEHPRAPYELKDNAYSLLDVSDLVFIDAPGTGFGRVKKGHEKEFYGIDQDAAAFAKFVRNFLTLENRWNTPKFIFGESYGTLRAVLLASALQEKYSIDVNGVILLSQILDYNNTIDGPDPEYGNGRAYQLALPTYAATAWYHHKIPNRPEDLPGFLKEVEDFAMTEYALALNKGRHLDSQTFNKIAEKLHRYTGLSIGYIKKANLRIKGNQFRQQLLLEDGKGIGNLDTRFRGPILNPLAEKMTNDPQSDAISSAYVSLFNSYVLNDLNYGKFRSYRTSLYGHGDVDWDWEHKGNFGRVNVMGDLAKTMKKNNQLKVLMMGGYYDIATPYFEAVYELDQLPIPKALFANISYQLYASGHMVYVNDEFAEKLAADVRTFINENKE